MDEYRGEILQGTYDCKRDSLSALSFPLSLSFSLSFSFFLFSFFLSFFLSSFASLSLTPSHTSISHSCASHLLWTLHRVGRAILLFMTTAVRIMSMVCRAELWCIVLYITPSFPCPTFTCILSIYSCFILLNYIFAYIFCFCRYS